MRCDRCKITLTGGRGAYAWRCETTAIGADTLPPVDTLMEREAIYRQIFEELQTMSPEEVERDVYQLWEGILCATCRKELGERLDSFLDEQ